MAQNKEAGLQRSLVNIRRDGEERDAQRRAARAGVAYIDIRKTPVSLAAIKVIPEEEAKNAKAASVEVKMHHIALAVFDPGLLATKELVKSLEAKKHEVALFVASLSGLNEAWKLYEFVPKGEATDITGKLEIGKDHLEELLAKLKSLESARKEIGALVTKPTTTTALFELVLAGALANKASDIHLEAEERGSKLRYRLDGVLHDIVKGIPEQNYLSLVSRLKLYSSLKINIRGEAQDGRFTIALGKKEIEVRVSIIPSEFGETIVMRVLDPDAISVSLEQLGLREDDLALVRLELDKPNGLILNTGPTGSGKTTTLYAFLRTIASPELKIITIEDPIEYHLDGIEQTQTDPEAGYTFASGLRAILRQDPDAILVGEIRDKETSDIALQASLTGHMVFSTLHTNDAVGAVPRLIDLGAKPVTIGPALSLVIAQRLVRHLCDSCKKPVAITDNLQTKIKTFIEKLPARVNKTPFEKPVLYGAIGCSACNGTGYHGRVGVFEFFQGGPGLEEVILKEVSDTALRRLAESQGMVTMQEDGILKTILGLTTFEEVEKVTGAIPWRAAGV